MHSRQISSRGLYQAIALLCLVTTVLLLLHAGASFGSPLESGSAGGDLYVDVNDPSSNDDNTGTESEPLRTIQEAADRATPGTTVNVKSGTYNETVEVTTSGVPGAPISFVSCGDGRAHVVATGYACFNLESVECVVIDGFELSGATACGSAAHGGGIRAFPESLADTEGDRDMRAVYWDFGARYCVFSNNIVHDNDAGIWLVLSHNNIIRDNVVSGSNEAPIRLKHSHNNEVLNNLAYNNGKTEEWGICFYGAPYTTVRHNTVYEPGGGAVFIYEGTSNLNGATPGSTDYCPPSSSSRVFDNIGQVCGSGATLVIGSSTTTDRDPALDVLYGPVNNQYHHNLWFRVTESKPVVSWGDLTAGDHMAMLTLEEFQQKHEGYGDSSMVTDPLFTDAANADFTLLPESPAKGTASDGYDQGVNPGVEFQVIPNLGEAYPASSAGSDLAVLEGVGFGDSRGDSYVSFEGKPAAGYSSWSDTLIVAEAPEGVTGPIDVTVTTSGGASWPASYWAGASTDWYLSEGSTGEGFETWVLVQNPGSTPAQVVITYMTPSGPVSGPCATISANS
ncbi:MAG: right-handed parallel beta-helix repeat-containing protein, partial [Actinobacteria bacterium]|nr:right-handed parallel beta-helix repeat-containing protein [Actinomycetota bacterium]MCG2817631.1 right-handed parallel beta-helix repeat-containing protein [Actinomycetes bacterium]MBU4218901.1 right-handed parallel beta-helix repeat-containing protein [Actinomycetota bacterium]MBU4358501.1 right-handed parallel beta-helix repeat-containing protein [Actinomycetota bacterium]MBU4393085.1 right-handed parallel beta-helix repeat-containing protein [Actinomycetota bacterium]